MATSNKCPVDLRIRGVDIEHAAELIAGFACVGARADARGTGCADHHPEAKVEAGGFLAWACPSVPRDARDVKSLTREWRRRSARAHHAWFVVPEQLLPGRKSSNVGGMSEVMRRTHDAMAWFGEALYDDIIGYVAVVARREGQVRVHVLMVPETLRGTRIDLERLHRWSASDRYLLSVAAGLSGALQFALGEDCEGAAVLDTPYEVLRYHRRQYAVWYARQVQRRVKLQQPLLAILQETSAELERMARGNGGLATVRFLNADAFAQGDGFEGDAKVCRDNCVSNLRDPGPELAATELFASVRRRLASINGRGSDPTDGYWTWLRPPEHLRNSRGPRPSLKPGNVVAAANTPTPKQTRASVATDTRTSEEPFLTVLTRMRLLAEHQALMSLYWRTALANARGREWDPLDDGPSGEVRDVAPTPRGERKLLAGRLAHVAQRRHQVLVDVANCARVARPTQAVGDLAEAVLEMAGAVRAARRVNATWDVDLEGGTVAEPPQ